MKFAMKFVMSFSVGVELVAGGASPCLYSTYTVGFALAGAAGSTAGILLSQAAIAQDSFTVPLEVLQVFRTNLKPMDPLSYYSYCALQGLATGTIVYVVFLEILPKARSVGGTGFSHLAAIIAGFLIFLPSVYIRKNRGSFSVILVDC